MHRRQNPTLLVAGLILAAALVLAGCGGRQGEQSQSARSETAEPAVPTMPAAQFAQPTTMIAVAPSDSLTETEEADTAEAAAEETADEGDEESAPTAEAEDEAEDEAKDAAAPEPAGAELTAEQARGLELYATRKCPDCHGPNAEGVAGKGSALTGTELSLEEFTDLIRTGGEIGPDHIFGPMTISPSGVTAIHAWLQTLPAE